MYWEWSKAFEKDLVKFVNKDIIKQIKLPDKNRIELLQNSSGRRQLIQDIYETLVKKNIRYAVEPHQPNEAIQLIRQPSVILRNPREGTCLDLAILFCSLCFGYELLPVLIIIEGHALVAVSLNHECRDWDNYVKERSQFKKTDLFRDLEQLCEWVENNSYLAIECTGFAKTQSFKGLQEPEAIGRDSKGLLSFERAIQAGQEQLNHSSRKFEYAIDIAVGQYFWEGDRKLVKSISLARTKNIYNIRFDNLNFKKDKLLNILEKVDDFKLIKSIYKKNLPKGSIIDDYNSTNPSSLEELIESLINDFNTNQEGQQTILDFSLNLIKKLDNNFMKQELHQWITDVVRQNKFAINIPDLKSLEVAQIYKILCPFLQIVVEPIPRPDEEIFRLKAEFIEDYQETQNSTIIEINIEWLKNQGIESEISFKDVPSSINQIIRQVSNEYLYNKEFNLTVEIFLTKAYLSRQIDLEEVSDDCDENQPIGKQYPLVIRSYERIKAANLLNSLKQRWKILNDKAQGNSNLQEWQKEFETPDELVKKQWDKLERCLTKEERIGLKISSNYPTTSREQEKLFTTILKGGVPICLWNRRRSLPEAEIDKMDLLLSLENIRDLNRFYQAILKLRKEAHAQGKQAKRHLGYHLGLLCDHGERIPDIKRLTRMV